MAEQIDALASWRHMADHLAPIWNALPPEHRGAFFGPIEVARWLQRPGAPYPVEVGGTWPARARRLPVLVASFEDHHAVRPRPTVLVNHGAGQSYTGAGNGSECFAGGPGRERAILQLEPGPLAGRAARAAGYRFEMVGSPRLDRWHTAARQGVRLEHDRLDFVAGDAYPNGKKGRLPGSSPGPGPIAFGFHHAGQNGLPEMRSAFEHYKGAIADLERVHLLGHGHPRSWSRYEDFWGSLGVRATLDFEAVLAEADVYVTDNSSTGVEFASTGRPVIWCSAPWYRRDVEHGGRFWDWPKHSLHVEYPGALAGAIRRALAYPDTLRTLQQPMVADVFVATDGKAAQRAADAIESVLAET